MQAEIIRSLQIAIDEEAVILDLSILQETAVLNRRDTIITLDELKQRLLAETSIEQPFAYKVPQSKERPSFDSINTYKTVNTVSSDLPSAVTIPDPEQKSGLARLLSMRKAPGLMRSPRSEPQVYMLPNRDVVTSVSPTTIDTRPPPYSQQRVQEDLEQDILGQFQNMRIAGHGIEGQQDSFGRDGPMTPIMNTANQDSAWPIQSTEPSQEPVSPDSLRPASALSFQTNVGFRSSWSTGSSFARTNSTSTTSGNSHRASIAYPKPEEGRVTTPIYEHPDPAFAAASTSPIAPDPLISGFHPGYQPIRHINSQSTVSTPVSLQSRTWGGRSRINSSSVANPHASTSTRLGRPCKENKYWGFCKGAWAAREDFKKGMSVQTRPAGYYSTVTVWECKECSFSGETFGAKPYRYDERIHTASCGIRYKWIFLVKSHAKKKNTNMEQDCNYGCIFCASEGKGTSIFGSVDMLMNHISYEHSQAMSTMVQEQTKCVFGRPANPGEDFDINVQQILELPSAKEMG
jgi:hypothetical protein